MRTIVFLFFMMIIGSAMAEQSYNIAYYHSYNIIDLRTFKQLSFRTLSEDIDINGREKGYYIFRIILGKSFSSEPALLLIENEHLDTALLYCRDSDSLILVGKAGNSFPETTSQFGLPQFKLDNQRREYYILTNLEDRISFKTKIVSSTEMNTWSTRVFFQLGVYYGISLMFFLVNIFLFVYLKERLFLHYCIFQTFVVLSIAYADGLFPFILSDRWILNHADIPLHIGMAVASTFFAVCFMTRPPKLFGQFLVFGSIIIMTSAYLCYLIFGNRALYITGESLMLAPILFFWISAIGLFPKHAHARFFVIGYGIFLIFALDYFVIRRLGVNLLDFYMGQLKTGSIVEMLVLSVAIMYRIRSLHKENAAFRYAIKDNMQRITAYESKEHAKAEQLFEKIQKKYNLTDREIAVFRAISEGLTNQQIADKVFLSIHTVKFHTRNIFDKLNITSRTQAMAKLRE